MSVLTVSLVLLVLVASPIAKGCFVECELGSHCQSYYDFRSGCSMCDCRGKSLREVCPNKMICPRNCPLVVISPGCYTCSCAFLYRSPFRRFNSPL